MNLIKSSLILSALTLIALNLFLVNDLVAQQPAGGQIAFIRNGDVWLMNSDGSNQRPWVAGVLNAKGHLSWSPDNKMLAFSRQGRVDIKYPEGGGGHHYLYDLFYAYMDSLPQRNNFWMGFTNTLGSQAPDWSRNGEIISFSYDLSGNVVDAQAPDYTVGFYNVSKKEITKLNLPKNDRNLMALMPAISPDGKTVCFVLAEFASSQIKQRGLVTVPVDGPVPGTEALLAMGQKISDGMSPAWSPDGSKILFLKNDGVYLANSDLSGERLVCLPEQGTKVAGVPSWSPDGGRIAFGTSSGSIYTCDIDGGNLKKISGPGDDSYPAWSK